MSTNDPQPTSADLPATPPALLTGSRKSCGWTPDRQRAFLEFLAAGQTVEAACRLVGLTSQSAYAFRARATGAAFAIGWHAALLLQRQRLADTLTARAFDGHVVTVTRADGEVIERHQYDNRLALAMLARADRIAGGEDTDRFGEGQAARLAAAEWERYLDVIGADAGPANAGLFLALRCEGQGIKEGAAQLVRLARADLYRRTGAGVAGEVDTSDLDLIDRAAWSADQWMRAEAAGLLAIAAPPGLSADELASDHQIGQHWDDIIDADGEWASDDVWWCPLAADWRTHFPPPAGFSGYQSGVYGQEEYDRGLADDERELLEAARRDASAGHGQADRDAWFSALADRLGIEQCGPTVAAPRCIDPFVS